MPEPIELDASRTGNLRWAILALLFLITIVAFVDRQTVSVLAPKICSSLHLSNSAYGVIVACLQFGMMSGEFPVGYLMDRIGTRLGLASVVLWWSAGTGAQMFTRTGWQLGLTRYWIGTGECGNFSGGVKTVTRFFKRTEQTLAIGIFNGGSVIGSTLATPLIVYLYNRHHNFRLPFLVPALAGLLWLPLWFLIYRREPPARELEQEQVKVSLREMLSDSSSWAVMMCRFFIGPVMQFYWYWIPIYLYNVRHLSLVDIGFLGWIPYLFGDAGGVLGGWSAGVLEKRGMPVPRMRKILMYGSSVVCAASCFVPAAHGVVPALLLMGTAIGADSFLSANMYAAISDLFPERKVGRATGLTGVAGGLSGLLFPLLTGVLVDRISYTPVFVLVSLMPIVGSVALFVLGKKYKTMPHPKLDSNPDAGPLGL